MTTIGLSYSLVKRSTKCAPALIVRYGKKKIVSWGTHTFYFLPIEYWAWLIPVFTILSWAICSFV